MTTTSDSGTSTSCAAPVVGRVRLAALALLLVHGYWADCVLGVCLCAPEACSSLRAVRGTKKL